MWWRERAPTFELVVSELVRREASGGDADAAASRLAAIGRLKILRVTDEAVRLAGLLVSKGPIPREYAEDALHISIAAVNGADYLLTWNCKHLANASHRSIIETVAEEAGYASPIICTPEELMED